VVFDGLELGTRCNSTRPAASGVYAYTQVQAQAQAQALQAEIFVDYKQGNDANPGTLAAPVKTAAHGLALLRKVAARGKALVLRAGVHFLSSTLALSAEAGDSGLTIRSHPGDGAPAWLSGGLELPGLRWKSVGGSLPGAFEADLSAVLPAGVEGMSIMADLHSLRLHGRRATAARYPNADIELDGFPTGYIMEAQKWLAPKKYSAATVVSVDAPSRANISTGAYKQYTLGIGGPCSIFKPPCSFWCKGTHGFTPSGLVVGGGVGKNWSDPVGDGAEVFAWRSGHWNNWMFSVGAVDSSGSTGSNGTEIKFGRGGFQGTRPGGAQEFYFSHIKEELDTANEFFLHRSAAKLLYIPNATSSSGAPPADGFVLTRVRTLLAVNGSKDKPLSRVTVSGIGFRDARATCEF
jgi:hypothetical protein